MRNKKKFLLIGLILIAAAAAAYMAFAGNKTVKVELAEVMRGDIEEYVEEKASVELENKVDIYAQQSGVVVFSPAEVGDEVKKGDVMLKIRDEELQLEIKSLELQKQYIEAQLEEAKKGVSKWDLQALTAKVRSAEIAYDEANREFENNRQLYEAGGISRDAYDKSAAALASAEANLKAAEASLEAAKEGVSENIEKQYLAQIDKLKLQINHLKDKKKDYIIESPMDGVVLLAEASEGSVIPMGSLVFQVGSYDEMFLLAEILVDDMSNIKEGSEVLIKNEDLGIKDIKGTVRKIYPEAFTKVSDLGIEQKRIKIEISIDERISNLKPGYDVDIKIITAKSQDTLIVDERAVFEMQGKNYVFVNDNGIAKLREIEKGLESNDMIEVIKGLKEGEQVIISPDESIEEGIKIQGKI